MRIVGFLVKGFDHANAAYVFLYNVVELVVVGKDFIKNRVGKVVMIPKPAAKNGVIAKNIMEMSRSMLKAAIMAKIIIIGARTAIRMTML